jgi:hypothetical protein
VDLAKEIRFLQANPHFAERPASIAEFLGEGYLEIESRVRPSIRRELVNIVGDDVRGDKLTAFPKAMITGGIGIGKTTFASIMLPYLAHWCLCMKSPQDFFNLLPGSRIAFMQMSTSGSQAKEVVFGDIKARIEYSPWFREKYPYDKNFKNQIRFPQKDIWILPGDSAETTFEGYNILGGILDEADSHKVTDSKDYAEQGYTTISSRISSRFGDRGFLLVIGQMKKASGFAAKKYTEFKKDPEAYASRMSIWESFGWEQYLKLDGTRDSFWYSVKRKEIIPDGVGNLLADPTASDEYIEVPNLYRGEFDNNPEKALRDLAGIPPAVGSPFISLTYRIEEAQKRYEERYGIATPYDGVRSVFDPAFKAQDSIPRVCHIDLAYSANGDALGFAMGHVQGMQLTDEDEWKPYIVIDCAVRWKAPAGREILISDVRQMIYDLRDNRGFKIKMVTMDGFQSTDTKQQLRRKRIMADIVSVDKDLTPYFDLRDAIYESRIDFPDLQVKWFPDDDKSINIIYKELTELEDAGKKIDHPPDGSKDVADAIAGVCFTLMGQRTYHRQRVVSGPPPAPVGPTPAPINSPSGSSLVSSLGDTAPIPPTEGPFVWRPPTKR